MTLSSTSTGIPFSNLISKYVGLSGKFFVLTQMNTSSGGSLYGS